MRLQYLADKLTGPEKLTPGLQTLVDFNEVRQHMVKELHAAILTGKLSHPTSLVYQYLKMITQVSDQLHGYTVVIRKHVPQKIAFLSNITDNLTLTITNIVTKWPGCHYLQLPVPAAFLYKKMPVFIPRWLQVKTGLLSIIQNEALRNIVETLVLKCKPDKSIRITWQRFLYTEDLLKNLEELLQKHLNSQQLEEALMELLVAMDYNEKDFIFFYTGCMEANINSKTSFYDKKDLLNWYFDKLEKLPGRIIPFTPMQTNASQKEYTPLKGQLLKELSAHTSELHQKQQSIEKEIQQLIWKSN